MATDRDEQTRQQRELEEIRRSFAEMGARMGSLFEPSEQDANEQPLSPPTPAQPAAAPARPRWWWGALALLFLAGTAFGWILPKGDGVDGSSASPPPTQSTVTTTAPPSTAKPRTQVSVPDACVDTAELADEVISRLDRNVRDQRLFSALRDYTIASQACRKEASS
jgi:hypothetical protein